MTIFRDSNQHNQALAMVGRLIGIDIGTKKIGIALSDESRFIATPKLIFYRKSNEKDFAQIQQIIDKNRIVGIVIGLPLPTDRDTSTGQSMLLFVEKFAENLDEFLGKELPIFFSDERLSSFEAQEIVRSDQSMRKRDRKLYDDIAASFILQRFLEIL